MMFCHSLKNLSLWIRSSEFNSCVLLLPRRCLYARPFGTVDYKSRKKGLVHSAQMSPDFHGLPGVCGKNLLLAPCLPLTPPNRNITSGVVFAAASSGQVTYDHGVYAKMADSAPVHLAESVLISLQEVTGLPWWANILCATVALRTTVTFPLMIYQAYILAKLENLQSEISSLAKQLQYEVSVYGKQQKWSEKVAKFHFRKNMNRIVTGLYVRDNCHPFKASLIMWIQIPMWIFMSLALRNFSYCTSGSATAMMLHKQLQEGGALWFPDLTVPDSTWILPLSLGFINLLLIEMFALRKLEVSKFQRYITNFLRTLSVVMIPITASVPSCMALYWVSSSCVGLTHNLLLRSPTIRRLFRVPRTKADSDTPYKDLLSAFRAKYFNRK
ncbi:cytochrome c oxidase assembly protein COX18, mitochondrial isoform 1-T2 [Mantella aurantiaca]